MRWLALTALPRSAAGAGIALCAVALAAAATAEPRIASTPMRLGLPGNLIGDAAMVALAFSLPALVAGLWLAARRVATAIGLRGALFIGSLIIAGAFAHATLEHRPDLLTRLVGL